ncbi:phage portal protein [Thalassobacter stenotrophicus]|uniref:Phage portal protein, lambda family n=2 Tax=Thalassobacter stenotrophicus TaxID=266809 RepID=A0A0N7LTB6_9RHOB|nr:phage portal protein [Thalassobacter stenotrophicus]CUH60242.1 phage portal protein, lambda family [Thalassobacter stenotrophicus]SHI71058.1 phage portal protein, lambda family [Thalassobacter stenotrophicus DSM 16310]
MSIISKVRDLLVGQNLTAPADSGDAAPRHGSQYMRGGRGVTFSGWRPALRESQDDISEAWDDAAARVADLIHNSGWLAGAVDQAVANTVGTGLRLKALPENETFGMSSTEASNWSKTVERRFELWARSAQECDIQGMRTFGQMQSAAFRSWLISGEILAELPFRRRSWNTYGTKVRLLPPHRLSRKTENLARLVNGVYLDADGMPVGYLAIRKDMFKYDVEYDVRARDRAGRPRVIHVFDGLPGTHRGISPMTPALQVARQFDQLADATLMASIVQTLFAVTITSDEPTEEVLAGLLTPQEQAQMSAQGVAPMEAYIDMVAGYYEGSSLNVGINGRLAHLFPGQELKFHTSNQPSSDYKDFSMHLLRELARCLGLTYESATGDNNGATYSSLQAATTEIFAITKARRQNIVAPFCQPVYEAWLEEEIASGRIAFPGGYQAFLANRAAACRAEWLGAARPTTDDLKKAKAHEVWKRLGVMSDAMICNDIGVDVDDVYQQISQERDMRQEYRLPDPMLMGAAGGALEAPDGAEADEGPEGDAEDDTDNDPDDEEDAL